MSIRYVLENKNGVSLALCALLLSGSLSSRAAGIEFEVASIKPTKSPTGVTGGCHGSDSRFGPNDPVALVPLGRCVITAGRLTHLMAIAYQVDVNRIGGRPEWEDPMRFDVEAKAESASATRQQLLQMLQALLEDRFKLKASREKKEVSGFALAIAKNGSKLKRARGDEESRITLAGAMLDKRASAGALNTIIGQKASMAQLVDILSRPAGGPIVDKTGLTGDYDFTISWEVGELVSSVLQEQLGLKLEPQKVSVDFMTILSAEKPSEN
jgi:uncharacterized protein (TIGR03435 family)